MRVLLAALLLLLTATGHANQAATECEQYYNEEKYSRARISCTQSAEEGDANAQTLLGEMYDQGLGGEPSPSMAEKWWQTAAKQSYLPAQNLLALKYYYGGDVFGPQTGWSQSYTRAFEIWQRSAKKGVESSQFMLGVMYMQGQGVARDYAEAYAYFQLALSGGYKLATDSLMELSRKISPQEKLNGQKRLQQLKKYMVNVD